MAEMEILHSCSRLKGKFSPILLCKVQEFAENPAPTSTAEGSSGGLAWETLSSRAMDIMIKRPLSRGAAHRNRTAAAGGLSTAGVELFAHRVALSSANTNGTDASRLHGKSGFYRDQPYANLWLTNAPSLPAQRRPPWRNDRQLSRLGRDLRQSRFTGRAKRAAVDDGLSAEGADDFATQPGAAVGNAVRSV